MKFSVISLIAIFINGNLGYHFFFYFVPIYLLLNFFQSLELWLIGERTFTHFYLIFFLKRSLLYFCLFVFVYVSLLCTIFGFFIKNLISELLALCSITLWISFASVCSSSKRSRCSVQNALQTMENVVHAMQRTIVRRTSPVHWLYVAQMDCSVVPPVISESHHHDYLTQSIPSRAAQLLAMALGKLVEATRSSPMNTVGLPAFSMVIGPGTDPALDPSSTPSTCWQPLIV